MVNFARKIFMIACAIMILSAGFAEKGFYFVALALGIIAFALFLCIVTGVESDYE